MQTQQCGVAVLNNSVVVFSPNYLPVARVNIKRAIALLVTGKAETLSLGNARYWEVRSPNVVLQVPEYIRLRSGSPERAWKIPPVNRREVLRRDGHTCQYCGSTKRLTIDHVIPRSQGGSHTWDNVVTACERCNTTKGSRTPHEAGMNLARQPKAPVHPALMFADQFWKTQTMEVQTH